VIFFTADPHYGHDREFIWKQRGFNSIEDHDALTKYVFSNLQKDDTLYVLGDVSCGKNSLDNSLEFLSFLKCKTIIVKGNHDEQLFQNRKKLAFNIHFIDSVYLDIKINSKPITLCHYPMVSWNKSHYNSLSLHGHVHEKKIPLKGKTINVAPTKDHMYPYSYDEIYKIYLTLPDNWDYIKK
jgi:calcineurin-like phosphoesterase family protein